MIGRLDRYVGATVLGSYVATLLFVGALWVIVDLLINLRNYVVLAQEQGAWEVASSWGMYQFVSLPWVFVLVAPFVTVISCMFAVVRLMTANELAPMLFTGRSMVRILAPALVMSLVSAGAMGFAWEFVLPRLARQMEHHAEALDRDELSSKYDSIVLFSSDRRQRLMCDRYLNTHQRMEGLIVIDTGSNAADLSEVSARAAVWHPERGAWELIGGKFVSGRHTEPREWLEMEGVTPEILWLSGKEKRGSLAMSYSEIIDLIGLSPGRSDLVISLHYHVTWPLANVLLLLLGLPFSVQFERGSRIGRTLLAITICGAYLLFDLTFQSFGRHEWLHPVLATWTPPILFGSLGIVMFGGIRS